MKKNTKNPTLENLKIITYNDVAIHCDVSSDKAQKIVAEMRKLYQRKQLTLLHLFDYLGISKLKVIYELVTDADKGGEAA